MGLHGLVTLLVAAWLGIFAGLAVAGGVSAQREASGEAQAWEYVSAVSRRLAGDMGSAQGGYVTHDPGTGTLRIPGTDAFATPAAVFCVEYRVASARLVFRRMSVSGALCGSTPLSGWLDAASGTPQGTRATVPAAVLCVLWEEGSVAAVWVEDDSCSGAVRGLGVAPVSVVVGTGRYRVFFPVLGVRAWP